MGNSKKLQVLMICSLVQMMYVGPLQKFPTSFNRKLFSRSPRVRLEKFEDAIGGTSNQKS